MAAVIPSRLYLLPEAVYDIIHEAIFAFQLHGAVRTVVHREDTAAVLAYVIALRPWAEALSDSSGRHIRSTRKVTTLPWLSE